eukprot:TRINITY_DN71_c0_g1::TRINITY_DN71_c0_g1_i1::g.14890::m.14890 TRINITY_DN71_c0_g1::TRINITY_DN71_c0_g1_i1::g.14890  ORF type:complete len:355 (+),score=56.82,sp/P58108/AAKG1_BOVIN/40.75/9e-64,CBS/PF00571.23/1.5e-05,CBS/PF00571.23/2.2e-05,CBS/PF00571.23/1.1e-06,CBS/PF00571.23/1.2e-08 TRINITY_DN71_c0_g1_i1:47-1066(+)
MEVEGVPPMEAESLVLDPIQECRHEITKVLRDHLVGDIIPQSVKVVVFDVDLPVRYAFYAMTEHDLQAAPLFDSKNDSYVGLLTVSDFINILLHYYRSQHKIDTEKFETQTIRHWRDLAPVPYEKFLHVDPSLTLYDTLLSLRKFKIHRLPIMDPENGTLLHTATPFRILEFLTTKYANAKESLKRVTLRSIGIGTFEGLITAQKDTPVHQVLQILSEQRVSAVPVVDSNGIVVDVYAKSDVKFLARETMYTNLDITVMQALSPCREDPGHGQVITCQLDDNLLDMIERTVQSRVARLVCVDENKRVLGLVSLSDLFCFFISRSVPHPLPNNIQPTQCL